MLLPIFCSVFFWRSAIFPATAPPASCAGWESYVNQRALVLAGHDAPQRVLLEDAEDVDRQLLVAAQRERRGIHDLEVSLDRLVEADAGVTLRARVGLRIGGVDAVDLGGLEHDLRGHLATAQRGGGVGSEE